jgi:serine/threonine protein phosphatase PrpC
MISAYHSYIHHSLKGINKKDNEDNFLTIEDENYYVFAIFDGVGSALNSKKATDLAKDFIELHHSAYFSKGIFLDKLMYDCNNYLLETEIPEAYTTYCAVFLPKESSHKAVYSYMGDSRIYIVTNQFIEQITVDDKLESRNVITKCLGMSTLETHDFSQSSINITDENLLLCTDGFYSFLEEKRLRFFEVFNKRNLKLIKDELMVLVKDRNRDDATYVLIK